MKNTIKTLSFAAFALLIAISFTSCDNKQDDPQPEPQVLAMVTQAFELTGINISTLKSFDPSTWIYDYNQTVSTFSLTGINANTGNNYSSDVTIDQLAAGSFTLDILPGEYQIDFVTPHTANITPFNETYIEWDASKPEIATDLDILIDDSQLLLGTPVAMIADHENFMIVVDIPNLMTPNPGNGAYGVGIYYAPNAQQIDGCMLMNYDATGDFWWVYLDAAVHPIGSEPLQISFYDAGENVTKNVDLSSSQPGNIYHFISDFGASTTLEIPDMVTQVIVVP